MHILLTGATGYIGRRLLPILLEQGHTVTAVVRDKNRFREVHPALEVIEADFLAESPPESIPQNIDAAYYLMHSMSDTRGDFSLLEERQARNFLAAINRTSVRQVIYLSGIVNDTSLSKHLASRKRTEEILSTGKYALTTLRAGIILGSGSASFEIMRDLVEKLPVMVTPRWLNTKSQPIAIRNVLQFLSGVLMFEPAFGKSFDIAGKESMTYKEMLLSFAKIRGLRRVIITIPIMTPRLSSYWLYFVTATSYSLAVNLVNSMKVEVIARPNSLAEDLDIELLSFDEAIRIAFQRIEQNDVVSSWKDSMVTAPGRVPLRIIDHVQIPTHGCFQDRRTFQTQNRERSLEKIWSIGGERGWYAAPLLWSLRGLIDKAFGGPGLRRGRTHPNRLEPGDALDFWRVLYADRNEGRLLLYAEMKLPGEAWIEFRIDAEGGLHQTATFRPLGLSGRAYWYAVLPFHGYIFNKMGRVIAS
ncbi:SDR family oxidoreductase [Leptonema illini]|uniref:NAD-dependent epimerase/dehydratase n=1 Tax=Leptonema illini DSM 21528 TaxID=929563 RepID=H2CBB7_9LEPT|nr:SDR family oxidoreductase [Leptonema illini]EHQ06288.1 NAD-dependent epimerase/dehydratase [Leptonema illini DSM 21528]